MKQTLIKILIVLINVAAAGLLSWFCIASYIVWVEPPIEVTEKASYQMLNLGLLTTAGILLIVILPTMAILAGLTSYIYRKIHIKDRKSKLRVLMTANLVIIGLGLIIGIFYARHQLVEQIENYFTQKTIGHEREIEGQEKVIEESGATTEKNGQ